jgi:hypothetical protein
MPGLRKEGRKEGSDESILRKMENGYEKERRPQNIGA